MPILDPSVQYYLCTHFSDAKSSTNSESSTKDFFLRYLKIASTNIYRNLDTLAASIQFKKDLQNATPIINKLFGSNFSFENDFNNPTIKNCYSYMFKKINPNLTKNIHKKQNGFYYIYKDIFQIRFFQPLNEFSNLHAWYFTDSPIAILCIDLTSMKENKNVLPYINLEIDLMIGAGFTIVLCAIADLDSNYIGPFLNETIQNHQFAEIHFNLNHRTANSDSILNFYSKIEKLVYNNNTYFYLYTTFFFGNFESEVKKNIKKHDKGTLCLNVFHFSDDMSLALNHGTMSNEYRFCHKNSTQLYRYKSFLYCKTGFNQKTMRIIICNVLLYNTSDKIVDFIPSCSSGLTFAYVSRKQFLNSEKSRVSVLFDDSLNNHQLVEKYIDFNDLHLIRPDFYVNDTLYLTKTQQRTLQTVQEIQSTADKKFSNNQTEEFEKESIFSLLKSTKIKKGLAYVTYAYQHYATYANFYNNFHVHTNQIFTALEACRVCVKRKDKESNGVVYQVETGEGKSCIIQLIAAVLAICNKTVHITSSNINLANRDYYDSYNFFQQLGLESAVLLHKNELPYVNFQNLPNDNNVYKQEFFPRKFFRDSLFRNSSNMNFSVCGLTNHNEITKDKANIVFSTFINFECLYLRMMEMCPSYIEKYFRDCSLLIDEADSILIDELTNGTIMSRPLKTNGKEILIFVYQCQRENKDPEYVHKEIKKRWPKCMDLSLDNVKEMYKEIEIVNQPEFINGKKYSIEKYYEQDEKKSKLKKLSNKIKLKKVKTVDKIKSAFKSVFHKKKKKGEGENKDEKEQKENNNDNDEEKNLDENQKQLDSMESVESMNSNDQSMNSNDQSSDSINVLKSMPIIEPPLYEDDIESTDSLPINESSQSSKSLISTESTESLVSNESTRSLFSNESTESLHYIKSSESFISTDKNKKGSKEFKTIIPFDYDHKGILEPNKEFSGFIQQFIAIKEMLSSEDNKNMTIKDVSMNYLFVSHPIFVKLYSGVVGLTGTIGNKHDKQILKSHYELSTKKIPRNAPNRRIELPVIKCNDIKERNRKIVQEVVEIHKKENPILVIFQDLNEISDVLKMLNKKGIKNINVFNGKDEKVKPDKIAGLKGAVSLGTNVCGRGTDIKKPAKPLHVIVTYFTSNTRVMYQAFGRTARQGNDGTVRIICLRNQYLSPTEILNEKSMKDVLDDFTLKNKLQIEFIQYFKNKREWIFSSHVDPQEIDTDSLNLMHDTRINVNRIKACNFEFPICMSIQTFLLIQAQKICSLYNCPNCKYTWMLFQKYLREMILETWSLLIDQVDKEFNSKQNCSYKSFLEKKILEAKNYLSIYITHLDSLGNDQYKEVPTFMTIFQFVKSYYQDNILKSFSKKSFFPLTPKGNCFLSFAIGFKPYSLVDKSGSRINTLDDPKQEQEFIMDPELKYMRKMPDGARPKILSITEKIDDIFNSICKKINEFIGCYTGLKFFLRRTLGGCEFGLCFDFELENENKDINNDYNCLVDKDPLFVFTICVKSMKAFLAGILIIGLVYIAKVAKSISDWIAGFPVKITSALVKKTVKLVFEELIARAASQQIENFCGMISAYLIKIIQKQIEFLKRFHRDLGELYENFLKIFAGKDFSKDAIFGFFCNNSMFSMKSNFAELINSKVKPMKHLLKIGFLLLMAFSTFMMNFHYRRRAIKYHTSKVAADYDEKQNTDEAIQQNDKFVDEEKFDVEENENEIIDVEKVEEEEDKKDKPEG